MVPADELDDGRSPWVRRALIGVAAALSIAALLSFALRPAPERRGLPDFRLPLLDGGSLGAADLEGHPVVLNFFASWCGPCREEAPLLQRMHREYEDQGVMFVGMNIQDTRPAARAFVKEFGITFPIALDYDREVATALGVPPLPQTFFVEEDGTFLSVERGERVGEQSGTVYLGAIEPNELRRQIEALLENG